MSVNYQPGRYRCSVEDQAFQLAKTGKPMIVLKVRPEAQVFERIGTNGEPFNEEETTSQQWPRTVRIVIVEDNEQTLDFAMRKLRHAGFTGSSFDDLDLRGKDVICDCKHETYDGNLVERWDLPLPNLPSRPLEHDPSVARKLNAIFGKRLSNGGTFTPPPQKAAGGTIEEDDDIPF